MAAVTVGILEKNRGGSLPYDALSVSSHPFDSQTDPEEAWNRSFTELVTLKGLNWSNMALAGAGGGALIGAWVEKRLRKPQRVGLDQMWGDASIGPLGISILESERTKQTITIPEDAPIEIIRPKKAKKIIRIVKRPIHVTKNVTINISDSVINNSEIKV
jgi:hypothetical protein